MSDDFLVKSRPVVVFCLPKGCVEGLRRRALSPHRLFLFKLRASFILFIFIYVLLSVLFFKYLQRRSSLTFSQRSDISTATRKRFYLREKTRVRAFSYCNCLKVAISLYFFIILSIKPRECHALDYGIPLPPIQKSKCLI